MIEFVGSNSAETALTNSITASLPAGTLAGDVAYVAVCHRGTANVALSEDSGTWAELAEVYSNDDRDTNFAIYRKVQGVTPDSTVTVTTTGVAVDMLALTFALRGVDPVSPEDVTTTSVAGTNTGNVNSPNIVPVTPNVWVLSVGGSTCTLLGTTITPPAGYAANFVELRHSTQDVSIVLGTKELAVPAAENPPNFAYGAASTASDSYSAVSIAVRPFVPVAAVDAGSTLYGGSAESDIAAYHARRRARLKQIEIEERKRDEAKLSLATEQKKLQAKKASAKQEAARLAKIAKLNTQIVSFDQSITKAMTELKAIEAALQAALVAEQARQQTIADRRRRLLLVSIAAA